MLFYCLLVCAVFDEKAAILKTLLRVCGVFWGLWDLLFISDFQQWDSDGSTCAFLFISHSVWGAELLEPEHRCLLYFFEYFFCLILFSPSGTLRRNWLEFVCFFFIAPQVPEFLLIKKKKEILPLFFRLNNFCLSIFKVTDFFFCYLHSSIKSLQWFFFLIPYIASFSSRV